MVGFIGRVVAGFLGIIGLVFCIPAVAFLWLAGTIALLMED